jgi:hypothetical protein
MFAGNRKPQTTATAKTNNPTAFLSPRSTHWCKALLAPTALNHLHEDGRCMRMLMEKLRMSLGWRRRGLAKLR